MSNHLLIFLGGGFGCLIRYWISSSAYMIMGQDFPYGTLIINITGSFLMGLLLIFTSKYFSNVTPQLRAFLLIGFLGGYTTFSSFSIETVIFFERGEVFKALLNIMLSLVLCTSAAWLGVFLWKQP